MGIPPSGPLFRINFWFAVAILASTTGHVFAEQGPAVQPASQTSTERKTLGVDQFPAETRAQILMARGEYAAAIVAYRQSNLKSAIVWNNIGMAYHHLFALDEARKAYEQALAINPHFAPASNNLAAVYYGQHDFREAEHWYKRALKHTSESAVIYCNLGTAYFAEGKSKKGMKMYQKAFAIDQAVFAPDQSKIVEGWGSREQRVEINYYIAETFASAGKQEQALIYLRKAMDEGFNDRKRLVEDKEFTALRTTPQFQKLLAAENWN